MRRALLALVGLAGLAALTGCGDDDPAANGARPEPVTEAAPAPTPPLPAPEPLVAAGGQTLVIAGDEVLWLVGGPPRRGGGLRVRTLSALGEPRGPWRNVIAPASGQAGRAPHVVEVVAELEADRLAVAWVERDQLVVRTRAVRGDASGHAFSRPTDLPERPFVPSAAPRGSVVLAAADGHVDVLYRETDGPCEGSGSARCARFARARVGEGSPARGLGWSLPEACARPLVGAAMAGEVHHHALCAVDRGHPATTVFAIQFEPQYAHAEKVLAGCEPLGLTPFGDAVAVMSDCPEGRRGVRVGDGGRSLQPLEGGEVVCREGRPLIRWGSHEQPLAEPRGGLAPLLPHPLAGPWDSAVWTGEALLIAHQRGAEAVVRRFACDRGTLRRTE